MQQELSELFLREAVVVFHVRVPLVHSVAIDMPFCTAMLTEE